VICLEDKLILFPFIATNGNLRIFENFFTFSETINKSLYELEKELEKIVAS